MNALRIITPYVLLFLGLVAGFIYGDTRGYARGFDVAQKNPIEGCADTATTMVSTK